MDGIHTADDVTQQPPDGLAPISERELDRPRRLLGPGGLALADEHAGHVQPQPTPTLSFTSYDDLMGTLTPRVLDLIEAIRREEPASINETARVVDRDVKNVHEELSRLAQLGIIFFEEAGQRKRPVVWFDELVITLPFDPDAADTATAAP